MGGLTGLLQGLKGVIGPSLPKRKTLIILVVAFLLGLFWAYVIAPTIYYDADPSTLRQEFQDEWVKLLADRQAATNADVGQNIAGLLLYVDDPLGIVDRLISSPAEAENVAKLQAIRPAAQQAEAAAKRAPQPNMLANILPFIVGPIVLLILSLIVAVIWNLLIYPFLEPTLSKAGIGRKRGAGIVSDQQAAAEISAIKAAKEATKTQSSDFATSSLGKPLIQKMSIYGLGRGQYDDSFSIEDENERFLGECGAGISETIGVGEPQKVTAIEVWLFDKDDFVRTVTKVFASAHAYNDPALRAKLEPKGDVMLVEPGAVAVMETSSLRLQARIVDITYGTGPLPANSYFEKMTLELAAWRKVPGAAPVPAPVVSAPIAPPVMPTAPAVPAAPTYSAPPVTSPRPVGSFQPVNPANVPTQAVNPAPVAPAGVSSSASPPVSPMVRPAPTFTPRTPPPRPPVADDDPFGGTGDFTPH